jgi:hypothetical protein
MYDIIICATISTLRQLYLAVFSESFFSNIKDKVILRFGLSELQPILIDLSTNLNRSQKSAIRLTEDDAPSMRRISGNQSTPR